MIVYVTVCTAPLVFIKVSVMLVEDESTVVSPETFGLSVAFQLYVEAISTTELMSKDNAVPLHTISSELVPIGVSLTTTSTGLEMVHPFVFVNKI